MPLEDDPWSGAEFSCRQYSTICHIPPNFLNDKHYTFRVILGEKPLREHVFTEFEFGFQVHDSGLMRQEYYGEWYGLYPPAPWLDDRGDRLRRRGRRAHGRDGQGAGVLRP